MKKHRWRKRFLLFVGVLIVIVLCFVYFSERKVTSPWYNATLNLLLEHSVPEKKVIDVHDLLKNGNVVLLDIRGKKEFDISHLRNSIWIGFDDFKLSNLPEIKKTDTIVVYCSVGYRSEKIAEKLILAGYTNVFNMYGGIFEWVNQEHSVYTNSDQKTLKIHGYNKNWGMWLDKGEKIF